MFKKLAAMHEDDELRDKIFAFLKETTYIYTFCKKYSILIEELLPKHKAPIHAANELKSLVFHLYNSANIPKEIDTNLLEAKEHLCRAFYDLHCMVVSIYITQVKDRLTPYKITTISNAFPEYASVIKPAMRDIQENLREIRTNRNTDIELLNDGIAVFENQVKSLARFDDITESALTELNKYDAEERNKGYADKLWDFLKIILGAVIGATATYFIITKNTPAAKPSPPQENQVTKPTTPKDTQATKPTN